MAETKADLATGVGSQQAIVKRLIQRRKGPVRLDIAGGQDLMENLDERTMKRAVYTWLRRVRWFEDVTLNLVADPSTRSTTEVKVEDFPDDIVLAWDRADLGKEWLAGVLSEHIVSTKLISIRANKKGVYITIPAGKEKISPSDKDWQPHMLFTRRGQAEYAVY